MEKKYNTSTNFENKIKPYKRKCKCGHTLIIACPLEYKICNYCGHKVYRNDQIEFKSKLLNSLKEVA